MREIHGIPNGVKITMTMQDREEQRVMVVDGESLVILSIAGATYPAGLTPDQARLLARQLQGSATRVEKESLP